MTDGGGQSTIPAGFTYLGQFVDHDLTFDKTDVMLGDERLAGAAAAGPLAEPRPGLAVRRGADRARVDEVLQGRRRAPEGRAPPSRRGASPAKAGFDLPRGGGTTAAQKRKAVIPDPRNDENLAVAQTHLAIIRFHNRVVDTLPGSVPAGAALRDARASS